MLQLDMLVVHLRGHSLKQPTTTFLDDTFIYNIFKIGLENFEMDDWGNYRADFAFFDAHSNRTVRLQVLGYGESAKFFRRASI